MLIHIENYRNLNNLDLEIEEGKSNFIFGVCGSGKSSVLSAIANEIRDIDVPFGKNIGDTLVEVDGMEPKRASFSLYETQRKSVLFSPSPSTEGYEIFVGDENELNKLEEEYKQLLDLLMLKIPELRKHQEGVEELRKVLGSYGAKGFTPKSKFEKMGRALSGAGDYAKAQITAGNKEYIDWCSKGISAFLGDDYELCPFCHGAIGEERREELKQLGDLSVSELAPFFLSESVLARFSIPLPDLSLPDSFGELKRSVSDAHEASREIEKIIDFCRTVDSRTMGKQFEKLDINPVLYKFFPEIEEAVSEINSKAKELTILLGKMSSAFQKMIRNDAAMLNAKLRQLGIPYQVQPKEVNRQSRTSSYILMHQNDSLGIDRRDALSEGEKNLVALLLFLQNPNADTVLIDDPASSYDDYRRSQIFRMITEIKGKTVLVVSHDQAFVRIASREKFQNTSIGAVKIMTTSSCGTDIDDIDFGSYGNLRDFVEKRIAESNSYFQKIINARLLMDLCRAEINKAWQYTSAILHGASRQEVLRLLNSRNWTEEEVLAELEQAIGIQIGTMPDTIERSLPEGASDFERLIKYREEINLNGSQRSLTEDEKLELDLLNDLVHMNYCMAFCLNPYRYRTWAPSLNDLL